MTESDVNFAIALAPEWRQIDLLAPDAGRLVGGPLAAALDLGARANPHARLLMVRSLFAVTPEGEPLGIGLSVALADRSAPVSSQPLQADDFQGCDVAAVTLPTGSGLRVREVAPGAVIDGAEIPVLRVQYLIETDAGLLTITLTTPQAEWTAEWEQLFDAMAQTAELS
jgi:hypothetical protein